MDGRVLSSSALIRGGSETGTVLTCQNRPYFRIWNYQNLPRQELPSQFMENWLYHKPTVDSFAVHYETGEPLPADIFEKIKGPPCTKFCWPSVMGHLESQQPVMIYTYLYTYTYDPEENQTDT